MENHGVYRLFNRRSTISNQQFLSRQHSPQCAFQFQELSFHVEAATVAAERAVGGNYTVAGDDNRDWIPIVGHAHGAKRIAFPHHAGDVSVTASLSIRNGEQRMPAGQLEVRASE